MKKGLLFLALATFLFEGSNEIYAQAGLKKANNQFEQWAYVDALNIYEKIEKRGFSSGDIHKKLGDAYYFNARYAEAEKQYERLFNSVDNEQLSAEYYFRYAQTLQHVGKTDQAKNYQTQFVNLVGSSNKIASIYNNEKDLKDQISNNSGRYSDLINLNINTPYSDYGSFVANNRLYFTSARDTGNMSKKVHTWTGNSFTSLYAYDLDTEDKSKNVKRFNGAVRSILNESSAIFTKDGNTMYFTRNNILDGARKYDENKNTRLKIYSASLIDGKWQNIKELPFNGDDFSTAHPTLNEDESIMYFASDRPGGFGESDLWQVTVNNGRFGNPINLGSEINTEARETFPFMSTNNELYFSSDGRVGLGGLDVFVTQLNEKNQFEEVQNIGQPINSSSDDFAYFIDFTSKKGFFSSNREGGKGNDDIYSFIELKQLKAPCKQDLKIMVVDAKTRMIIPNASVTLYDAFYNNLGNSSTYSNDTYVFNTEYECGATYRIKVEKADYNTIEEVVTLANENGVTEKTIVLERKKIEVKKNDDLFKVLKLNPIYFDLDKSNIRPDAALELAKVVEVLKDYPKMKIDVRSHTDSRGSDSYNLKLSQQRAKSTANWIISQGIDASRVTNKGYGETKLLNDCKNGAKCSEEQHQENRRSEFIILEL